MQSFSPIDVFSWIVLLVLILATLFIAYKLGSLPGVIAARRQHPQTQAIRVAGWIGLITLGLFWPIALVWAYLEPRSNERGPSRADRAEIEELKQRVEELQQRLAEFPRTAGGEG